MFVNSKFTINDDEISIDIYSVHVKYREFFTILQNLGLLKRTENKEIVIIKDYALAKKFLERPLRKISPEEFEKEQEKKRINGLEAEKFVVDFEKKRLKDRHVEWVAQYVVNAGYDVASYNNVDDKIQNRFIEVKSYDGPKPYFYWSRNEYTVAKRKKKEYWLYLVNRGEMNDINYKPLMLQNPFNGILKNDDWDKQIDKYKISKIFNDKIKITLE